MLAMYLPGHAGSASTILRQAAIPVTTLATLPTITNGATRVAFRILKATVVMVMESLVPEATACSWNLERKGVGSQLGT
jgi:hypothetical protein